MVTWGVTDASTGGTELASVSDEEPVCSTALLEQLTNRRQKSGEAIPRPTDECYSGEAAQLLVPCDDVTVTALDCNAQYTLATASELPAGSFLLSGTTETTPDAASGDPLASNALRLYVRFDGPASLRPTCDGTVLSLWESKSVTVGSRETTIGLPRVQVPETAAGLATGISYLSAAHHTTSPSRSHPNQRDHPPLLTTGETVSIPDSIAEQRPTTGIELRLPSTVESLFVAAPLAYYLGAEVCVDDRERPILTATGTDVRHEFSPLPTFQKEVASLLQQVFYLDCLVRRMSPESAPELLEACSLDRQSVRTLSPAGRLERYLSTPTETVRAAAPEWHLSTHARPSHDRARCLPFLLDKLSLVYLSEGSELDRNDLLDRTLADAYPTRGSARQSSVLDPRGGNSRVQAWLAPGTPIDAFKTTTTAYENRYRFRDRDNDRMQVSVVLNDTQMSDEQGTVTEIYRAADLPMDVTVSESLTTVELADVFEAENDFVHFIGHCDDDGLRCPDGNLSAAELSHARTPTFFLNACGSYEEGLDLVERGAVAGAVTFNDVLDRHAAMVGTAFARLLSNGFSIQRALQLARRRIMMGHDYAVVGDGTYALLPSPTDPVVVWVQETADGYDLVCEVVTPRAGDGYALPFDGEVALNGRRTEKTVTEETLVDTLESVSVPVIFDGGFHWSRTLATRLRASA
ncbi:hypothetical protein NDI85_00945 [Halomicroarcula sp. S1AR25-4]|uniref:hypothetical protein n=1 Tax=Haloarcula sp. S1AR25-4 TaxID=2950538 RepID=UPI0028766C3D|nr:hypothetical protein [Halomicroarcula sp. S1AR25-4]MDS0276370.1 hypothetical protein [Halomicroarcula sp. S1AR25-4]